MAGCVMSGSYHFQAIPVFNRGFYFYLQMIGVANTVARIASGYLADLPCVDALVLNNIALVLGTTFS